MAAALARRKAEIVELTERATASRDRQREYRSADPEAWHELDDECHELANSIVRLGYLVKMQEAYLAMADRCLGAEAGSGADAN